MEITGRDPSPLGCLCYGCVGVGHLHPIEQVAEEASGVPFGPAYRARGCQQVATRRESIQDREFSGAWGEFGRRITNSAAE